MEVVISKVVAYLDEKIYLLFELFDLERRSYEFILGCILSLKVQDGTFKCL